MTGFSLAFQIVYLVGAVLFLGGLALVTRARGRRLLGVLASVAVFTALSAPIDTLGHDLGLWWYPSCVDPPHPPLLVYIGQAMIFVGGVALVGWRVQRRWGTRGLGWLAAVVCVVGLMRDSLMAVAFPELMRLGPAPAAQLADLGAWGVVVAIGLGVSRLVAGPAQA